jgi:hypothetical protein
MTTAPGLDAIGTSNPPMVFIGVIARHTFTVATGITLQRLAVEARNLGFRITVPNEESGGIALARNLLTERFYDSVPQAGWFLSFDDDVGRLTGADLLRMLKHRVDVVGAPLPGRAIQPYQVRHALDRGEPFDSFEGIHENLSPLLVRYVDNKPRFETPELCEVEGTSAGCLLVSRRAMGMMIDAGGGRFAFNERRPPRVWEFTEQTPDDSFGFCKKWRELGGKVYVDALTKLSHVGIVHFTTKPLAELARRGLLYAGTS